NFTGALVTAIQKAKTRLSMAKDALIKAVRQLPLLEGLKPLQITEIARRANRTIHRPRSIIVRAGVVTDAAILIISGKAERLSGPGISRVPQTLPPGTIIAEMAMIIEFAPNSTIMAASEVRALHITRDEMHRMIADDPELAKHLISKAANRLKDIASQMRRISDDLAEGDLPEDEVKAATA
ncbi:MAG: Crp/Fnr family transcriptional regulator, partial [Hyphomicrobiaceae bacterium]